MIIEYDGERYDFDFDDITVKQAMKIEKHVGVPLSAWGESLEKGGDLLALQALGWLILFRGRDIPVDDADFKMARFGAAFEKALKAETEAQAAADAAAGPTVAVPASSGQPDPAANGAGEGLSPASLPGG